MKISEVLT